MKSPDFKIPVPFSAHGPISFKPKLSNNKINTKIRAEFRNQLFQLLDSSFFDRAHSPNPPNRFTQQKLYKVAAQRFAGIWRKMRTCCHSFLAFILKFLNFLQAFVGVCIIVYSVFMLNEWSNLVPVAPPAPPVAPAPYFLRGMNGVADEGLGLSMVAEMISGVGDGVGVVALKLPAPWFIYSFMAVGITLCSITCIGLIAAEAINGCCLCFYSLLAVIVILLEASFVVFVAFDHHWEEVLPFDPTGELDTLKSFIAKNLDLCKWVGITILIIQGLSLLLAFILRASVTTQRENKFDDVESNREPLIYSHPAAQTSYSSKGDNIWSSRLREKYGLGSSDNKYTLTTQTLQ